jgi:hypothetical protein
VARLGMICRSIFVYRNKLEVRRIVVPGFQCNVPVHCDVSTDPASLLRALATKSRETEVALGERLAKLADLRQVGDALEGPPRRSRRSLCHPFLMLRSYTMGGRAAPTPAGGPGPALPPEPRSLRERFGALRNLPPFLKLIWQTSSALTVGDLLLRLVRALLPAG